MTRAMILVLIQKASTTPPGKHSDLNIFQETVFHSVLQWFYIYLNAIQFLYLCI